jgi:chaperonin GroEL
VVTVAPAKGREAGLLVGAEAREALASGIGLLAQLVARTLGPTAGGVVASREARGPEVIRSGGVLARRIIAGEDRSSTVGMMLLRHGVWRVHEAVGDGGALTAALIHSLAGGGIRLLAGGFGAVDLRRGLERALAPVTVALHHQARPLMSAQRYLPELLRTAVADPDIGAVLGSLFAEVGPEVAIDVEEYAGLHAAFRLVSGCRLAGRKVFPSGEPVATEQELAEPYVFATTAALNEPRQVVPLVESILAEAGGPLVIVAPKVSDKVLGTLKQYADKSLLETLVWQPSGPDATDDILDIALVVGAQPFIEDRGDQLKDARVADLGYTARARARREWMELAYGAGDPEELERHRARLHAQLGTTRDTQERQKLLRRVGVAAGRFAILEVGASTDTDRKDRIAEAQRATQLVPAAMAEGVVAGGGASLLNCLPALDALACNSPGEEAAVQLMRQALTAPMTWLVRNSGGNPGPVLHEVRRSGADLGYDVRDGAIKDMWGAGVVDPCKVVRLALEVAVSTVSSLLSSEVLVLASKPELSVLP